MSSISQTKQHHWKMLASRKTRMDSIFQPGNAQKRFTPLKDNSMRDSKVFQRSRQRSNSSFAALNKSRDIDAVSTKQKKSDKIMQSTKTIHPQHSALISTIKNSQFRLTDSAQLTKHHASAMSTIAEVQKQFKKFKDKVMKLIQRQQQQINQLAKEILNTFQFQLSKLKEIKSNKCEHCQLQSQNSKNQSKSLEPQINLSTISKLDGKLDTKPKPKEIEDLKQELNKKLQKVQKTTLATINDDKRKLFQKSKSARQIPMLSFQKIHSRFDNVFDIFSKLKSDMSEMEEIRASLQKKKITETVPPINGLKK